jgi:hypothetical protein
MLALANRHKQRPDVNGLTRSPMRKTLIGSAINQSSCRTGTINREQELKVLQPEALRLSLQ